MNTKRIVITGGPCVGKTALVDALESVGYPCLPEIIREFTAQEADKKDPSQLQSNPIVFADDSLAFNQLLLNGRLAQYKEAATAESPYVFIDRGMPDVLAYMDYFDQSYGEDFTAICQEHPYDHVFVLPPWKEIYTRDAGRFETFEEAQRIHQHLVERYQHFGHSVTLVPKDTITARMEFILEQLKHTFD